LQHVLTKTSQHHRLAASKPVSLRVQGYHIDKGYAFLVVAKKMLNIYHKALVRMRLA
jgi:hypothetical protein